MITAREQDGPAGRLRVEKTWAEIRVEADEHAGWHLIGMTATLDGQPVTWPESGEIAGDYAGRTPAFRAWLERREP